MTLSAGSRLGPYEILAPLGAGGMGEVYRRLRWLQDPPFGQQAAAPPDAEAVGAGGCFATGAESFKRESRRSGS
ncbi:MAG TPA: hypothetical protein VGK08_06445 [Thermoanaerobaculia bacterium]|jgi:hypothetical protein